MPNLTPFRYRSILIAGRHGAGSLSHRTGPNQASNKGAEMADSMLSKKRDCLSRAKLSSMQAWRRPTDCRARVLATLARYAKRIEH